MPRDMHTIRIHSLRSYSRAVNSNRLVFSGAFRGIMVDLIPNFRGKIKIKCLSIGYLVFSCSYGNIFLMWVFIDYPSPSINVTTKQQIKYFFDETIYSFFKLFVGCNCLLTQNKNTFYSL